MNSTKKLNFKPTDINLNILVASFNFLKQSWIKIFEKSPSVLSYAKFKIFVEYL